MRKTLLLFFMALLLPAGLAQAQTGKISGVVLDAQTNEPLPGVNVAIVGTTIGAITDIDGYYNILNVDPGRKSLRASFVGYTPQVVENVDVSIDLTTEVNFNLQEETVGLDELVVTAEAPIIQRDIAGTQRNIGADEIQSGRYQSVTNVIAAQVGVSASSVYNDRPSIRGGGFEESQFIVDGVAQGDPLTNRPFYKVNLDAVEEIKLQTGGFSAEYGNLQSGLVNVALKEGGDRYSGSFNVQYSPPSLKHFGPMMFGFNSPIVEPFVDPSAGAFSGVDGNGNANRFFAGWNAIATKDQGNAGPYYVGPNATQEQIDLAAKQLYARYLWRHRSADAVDELKRLQQQGIVEFAPGVDPDDQVYHEYGDSPDYQIRATFGGPLPLLNSVKFFVTYDQDQTEYSYRFPQPNYEDRSFRGKLTTRIARNTKVNVHGFWARQSGGDGGQGPGVGDWISNDPYRALGDPNKMWYPNCAVPGQQTRQIYGLQLTHTFSANTFANLDFAHHRTDYAMISQPRDTAPLQGTAVPTTSSSQKGASGAYVDAGRLIPENALADGVPGWENWEQWRRIKIGDWWYDESPKGYGPVNWRDVTGEYRMESCNLRFNETYSRKWEMRAAVTSQVNRYNQIKSGFEVYRANVFQYYEAIDPSVNGGSLDESEGQPWVGALYARNKLEYRGFVADLGLRLDGIVHSKYPVLNGAPGDPDSPYSQYLLAGNTDSLWQKIPLERVSQFRLSPRLGISHPISSVAKIFFNYGHMYQWPESFDSYRINYNTRNGNRVGSYGNPLAEPPRTIMYEVGYEHNLFDRMSLRMTGYYRDVNNKTNTINYEPLGQASYNIQDNRQFEDVRGLEAFLELRRGTVPYFSGWVSANYQVESEGNFGYDRFFEDPTRQPNRLSSQVSRPDVRPLLKANIDFTTPDEFGPSLGGFSLVGGLGVNLLYTWKRGAAYTWNPENLPSFLVQDNTRYAPYTRFDLRATKNLWSQGRYDVLFYVDVTNLFNNKNLTPFAGDQDVTNDRGWAWDSHKWWKNQVTDYMYSLDLYVTQQGEVKGKDRPGDYPKDPLNYTYTPINRVADINQVVENTIRAGEFYYDRATDRYLVYDSGAWQNADMSKVDKVLKDKSYIKMPGFTPWSFLEKRDIFFGVKLYF